MNYYLPCCTEDTIKSYSCPQYTFPLSHFLW